MRLVYAYIGRYRNYEGQAITFVDDYRCSYVNDVLSIKHVEPDKVKEIIYGDSVLRNLTVVVGETGSGKTNLFQLLGKPYPQDKGKLPHQKLRYDLTGY